MQPGTGVLGIDIGGTKVAVRLETAAGRRHEAGRAWPAAGGPHADLTALAGLVAQVVDDAGEPPTRAAAAVPALTDAAGLVSAWPGRPGWVGLSLGQELARACGMPVIWADDGDLAALAEARRHGYRNLLYLGVGTGLGGGLVQCGRLVPGPGRGSCEVGHVLVRAGGERCDCGRSGCAQAYASGPAMLRRAGRLRAAPVSPAELAAGWRAGSGWAREAIELGAGTLAVLVHAVHELAILDDVVIGGGFTLAYPGFVEQVAAGVRAQARAGRPVPRIRAARSGLSSLDGAICLAADPNSGLDPVLAGWPTR